MRLGILAALVVASSTALFAGAAQAQQGESQRPGSRSEDGDAGALADLRQPRERIEIDEERVLDRLARLAKGSGPVLVGPWAGEVGFELVYWIPFVRWALGHAGIDPARVTVLSRGGTASWYAGFHHAR